MGYVGLMGGEARVLVGGIARGGSTAEAWVVVGGMGCGGRHGLQWDSWL